MSKYLFIVLLVIPGARATVAQDNPVLPDLAPRVVEITGDLSISFPSLDRQPLVGFNPPPRVPEIPSSRRPYTELYKQSTEELPPSPLNPPEAPEVSSLADRAVHAGMVTGALGRYTERVLRGTMSVPLNAATSLVLNGDYRGTDGHEPFPGSPPVNSGSDAGSFSADINHRSSSLAFGGGFNVNKAAYSLFGTEHTSGSVLALSPDRVFSGWSIHGHVGTKPGRSLNARVGVTLGASQLETDVYTGPNTALGVASQEASRFLISGLLEAPINDGRATLSGQLNSQKVDAEDGSSNPISSGQIAGLYRFSQSQHLTVEAGVAVLGFDAAGQTAEGGDRSLIFLSPEWNLTYRLQPGTDLSFSNSPDVASSQLEDLLFSAPFVQDWSPIQPVVTPLNLRAGISWYNEFIRATAGFGLKNVENHRVIDSPPGVLNGFSRGYMRVNYEEASVTYLDASLAATFAPGIQADATLTFRRGRLDSGDTIIPHFSPVTFGGSLALGLFDGKFSLRLSAQGEGARYAQREKTTKLDSVVLFGAEGTWFLTPQAGLLLGLKNLGSNTEFWDNYEWESNVVYLGGKWRW